MKTFYVYFKPSWSHENGKTISVTAKCKRDVILKYTMAEKIISV